MNPHAMRNEYQIHPRVDIPAARSMVERFHYARGASNTATFLHGLIRDDSLVGVAWWIPPTKAAALSVDEDWRRVICLSRLVISPGEPTNAASLLLGASMRLIRKDGRFHTLLTYADEGEGHTGAIYRATNWEFVETRPGDPRYIDPQTGRHVARKAGGKTRTRSEMESLGFEWTPPTRKHKFVKRFR